MSPEAADYLEKACDDLVDARKAQTIGLAKIAARTAYYAAFHATDAYIIACTGKVAKSHSGVRSEFARLAKSQPEIDSLHASFLAKAYIYKEISDYGVGPTASITISAANGAVVGRKNLLLASLA